MALAAKEAVKKINGAVLEGKKLHAMTQDERRSVYRIVVLLCMCVCVTHIVTFVVLCCYREQVVRAGERW